MITNSRSPLFDSHLHIIAPDYPLQENNGYLPAYFSVDDYRTRTNHFDVVGGAVVSGSFQGFDQSYLVDALALLGSNFVGVTQLPKSVSDAEILALHAKGVRALRFNVKRGGSEDLSQIESFALRVYELAGWHVELYADTAALSKLESLLLRLPRVSIDHLGLSKSGLPLLYRLVEKDVRVKATGFGRIDFDPLDAIKRLYAINPDSLMFGTDLPCTRAPKPFQDDHLYDLRSILDGNGFERVTRTNAQHWYGVGPDGRS